MSLYIDTETLKRVEEEAKRENISLSKWVRKAIDRSLHNHWPEGYFRLFGAISDSSFGRPANPGDAVDIPREKF